MTTRTHPIAGAQAMPARGSGARVVTCASAVPMGGDSHPPRSQTGDTDMSTTTAAAPIVDIFDAPAPAPAKPATETPRRGGNVPAKPATYAAIPSDADLATAHAFYAARGETAIVFGYEAGRETLAAIVLDPCHRVQPDGTLAAPEKSIVSPVSGDGSRLLARSGEYAGQYVTRGATIAAPTTGDGPASKVATAFVLGHGIDGAHAVDLAARSTRSFKALDGSHVTYCPAKVAHVLSVEAGANVRKDGTWYVTGRMFTGAPLPRTNAETLSLAAMAAGMAPAAVAALVDHPNTRTPRKRAAKRAAK